MTTTNRIKQVKIAIMVARESEDLEVVVPYDLWKRAKISVETISIDKKNTVLLAHGTSIKCSGIISKTNLSQFNAIYLPGGPGFVHLASHPKLRENLIKFSENPKKYLLALCAAPIIYKKLDLYKKCKFTCYPATLKEDTEGREVANYVDAPVVVSGQFVTGQAPGSVFDFSFAVIETLMGKKISKQIREATYYK